jgi:hypothetical protein
VAATVPNLFTRPTPAAPPPKPAGPPPLQAGPPPIPDDSFASGGPETWSLQAPPGLPGAAARPPSYAEPMDSYGPPGPSFGRRLGRHFQRLFTWNLQKIAVDEDERRILASQAVEDPTLQRYLVWRHSLLLILVVPVFLLALLNTISWLTSDLSQTNAFGKAILVFFILFPFALPFAALLALIVWYRPKLSWRLLLLGWIIGTLGPLLLHVVPATAQLNLDQMLQGATEDERRFQLGAVRFIYGVIIFGVLMFQLVIFGLTAAYGAQRACLRLKTLLPQSSIPGLFLAVTAPVFTMLLLPFFVTANQLAPNPLLFFGMLFVMMSPLIFTMFFKRMVSPLHEGDFGQLRVLQIVAAAAFWLGALLILIYALAIPVPFIDVEGIQAGRPGAGPRILQKSLLGFTSEHSWFRPWSWQVLRYLLVEVLGRSLFTMILVADLFMRVNSYIWLASRKVLGAGETTEYDKLMERLQTSGRWERPERE